MDELQTGVVNIMGQRTTKVLEADLKRLEKRLVFWKEKLNNQDFWSKHIVQINRKIAEITGEISICRHLIQRQKDSL
jgi:hypothetical protein